MKKAIPLFTIAGLLVVVVLTGRTGPVELQHETVALPSDLDGYLAASETPFKDIVAGAEKTIFWADSARQRTPVSVVYLHGFSATRQETAPLSDSLAKRWGANLFYTRLKGHGRTEDALGEAKAGDWLDDAREAMDVGRHIGERVVIIGTSTGGTLATWLAMQPNMEELAAIVLISPNYWPRAAGVGLLLWPHGSLIGKAVEGEYVQWEPANEGHERYWTNRYPITAAVEMMRLVKHVNDLDLGTLDVPTLVIYSPNDQVVDPVEIERTYEEIASSRKQIIPLDSVEAESNHVLAGDILSPGNTDDLINMIDSFIQGLSE